MNKKTQTLKRRAILKQSQNCPSLFLYLGLNIQQVIPLPPTFSVLAKEREKVGTFTYLALAKRFTNAVTSAISIRPSELTSAAQLRKWDAGMPRM